MTGQFTPINTGRAEKIEREVPNYETSPDSEVIRILAWADSREELELMQAMSDEELEAYLDKKRKGGRE